MRYFVHTGFDLEPGMYKYHSMCYTSSPYCLRKFDTALNFIFTTGCLNYKHLFLLDPTDTLLADAVAAGSDEAPFYQQITRGMSSTDWY
jgi:hypothetical protein